MTKLTITKQILFLFLVSWIVGTSILGISSYMFTKDKLIRDVRVRLKGYAELGILGFPSDDHQMLKNKTDESTEHYSNVVNYLRLLKLKCEDAKFVYSMRKTKDGIIFVGDAETDQELLSNLGDIYEDPNTLLLKIAGGTDKVHLIDDFYTDEWGTFLAAYTPIYTKDGTFDGILGIDISIEQVNIILTEMLINLMLIFSAVNLVIIPLLIAFTLNLTKPLNHIIKHFDLIKNGDFTQKLSIKGKNEFSDLSLSFGELQESLSYSLLHFRGLSEASRESSYLLSASSSQVSSAIEQMSANIDSINHNTEILSQQVKIVDEARNEINISAINVDKSINEQSEMLTVTSTVLEETVNLINESAKKTGVVRSSIIELSEQITLESEKIEEFTLQVSEISGKTESIIDLLSVIKNVASQTDLLSMNAAIEAAHAGDSGKGFAVVADEIRKLAETTAKSSNAITVQLTDTVISMNNLFTESKQTEVSLSIVFDKMMKFTDNITDLLCDIERLSLDTEKILNAHNKLVQVSITVNDNSYEMTRNTEQIEHAMLELLEVSEENHCAISELRVGVSEVVKEISGLTEISQNNIKNVTELEKEIKKYSVSDVILF